MSQTPISALILALILGLTAGLVGCDEDAAPPPEAPAPFSNDNTGTLPGDSSDAGGSDAVTSGGSVTPPPSSESEAVAEEIPAVESAASNVISPVDWKLEDGLVAKLGTTGTTLWLNSPITNQFAHVAVQGTAKPSFSCTDVQVKMNTISEYSQSLCKQPDKTCWTLMVSFDASAFTSNSYTCTVGVEGANIEFQVKKPTVSKPATPDATTDGIQLKPPADGVKMPNMPKYPTGL